MTISNPLVPARVRLTVRRNEYFAAVLFACGANGLALGLYDALRTGAETVSWIVYLGFVLAIRAVVLAPPQPLRRGDLWIGGAAVLLLLWPMPDTSWLAMTLVALYLFWSDVKGSALHAGASIALALTIQPFWGRLFPMVFAGPLERLDTQAVAFLTGATAHANRMDFAHGPGGVVVAWQCTSFANASLALLLWVALTRTVRPLPRRGEWLSLAGLFATVFAINTARLALMAQSQPMQHLLHGPAGQFWTGILLLLASLGWCLFGLRRELAA